MTLDPTQPFYVIELGTGSGKFSFFMLKALLEMKVNDESSLLSRCCKVDPECARPPFSS